MKKTLITASIISILAASFAVSAENISCPKASVIRDRGVGIVGQDVDGDLGEVNSYSSIYLSNYETPRFWSFSIGNVDGSDRDDAYAKATTAMNTVSGNPVITTNKDGDQVCVYSVSGTGKNGKPMTAVAYLWF